MKSSATIVDRPAKSRQRSRKVISSSEIHARSLQVQAEWSPVERKSREVTASKSKKRYRIDSGSRTAGIDPITQAHINFAWLLISGMS